MIDHYIERFRKLRRDRNAKWPVDSLHCSPYKPLLLLSAMDLLAQGNVTSNLIKLNPDLGELFNLYYSLIMPPDWRCNIAQPFFHLSREGFWHLVPLSGKKTIIASGRRLRSVKQIVDTVEGVKLDEELYGLLCVEKSRNMLRTVLIETYFAPEAQPKLVARGAINLEMFEYSQTLLDQARKQQIKEGKIEQEKEQSPVRGEGFRRAVVTAYNHCCALCGIRVRTPDGHTAVVGAHIIPWSKSHNNDPRNGMALCYLCHWAFDEGLISVSLGYVVMISPRLAANHNIPGHLATSHNRGLIGPEERLLWPDPDSLEWHLTERFRKF